MDVFMRGIGMNPKNDMGLELIDGKMDLSISVIGKKIWQVGTGN